MTIKELLPMLESPKEVSLSWNGDLIGFNFDNKIEVDVWGDYVVWKIIAAKERVYELVLAAQPVKKGAAQS